MYLTHFGLNEAPFRITPATGYFFAGAQRGDTLDAVEHALKHDEGIIKITGEVGAGKTMLLRMLLDRLPQTSVPIWLSNPSLVPGELLQSIAFQLGAERNDACPLLDTISDRLLALWGQGRRAVALIDEAHAMPQASLEQVRLLANLETPEHKLLQIVLFGQSELEKMLATYAMRPMRDRITHHFELAPLSHREVAAYIEHRLTQAGYQGDTLFTRAATYALAYSSAGLTRRINILADKALLAAYAAGERQVGLKHVRLAARDAQLRDPLRPLNYLLPGIGIAGIAGAIALQPQPTPLAPPPQRPAAASVATPVPEQSVDPPAPSKLAQSEEHPAAHEPPEAPPLGRFVTERLHQSREWLANADGAHWYVQLGTAEPDHMANLERQLKRLDTIESGQAFRIYAVPGLPPGRLLLIWGDFASAAEARQALAKLPEWARNDRPYVRGISSIKPLAHTNPGADSSRNSVKMRPPATPVQETNRTL
ncbi:MAG: AAA family ATPase [Betaproteobacteria bacterium]|nr:AAA family ATPase [Betaproteobacteria bacterium]